LFLSNLRILIKMIRVLLKIITFRCTDKHKKAAISVTKLAAQVVTCFDSLKLLNFPPNKISIEMYSTVFLSRRIE